MSPAQLHELIPGHSESVRRLRDLVARIGPSTIPVLIQGPTGAGKEYVARALHLVSGRPGAFVAFNVCAIADTMFEDALFGHVRGSFSGATAAHAGFLAEADRGTVVFDEIGALAKASQAKLLRAVETRKFRPIGGGADWESDFRLISSTNVELRSLVAAGGFRADLAFRLSGLVITVPSLAERRVDLPILARLFATAAALPDGREAEISTTAVDALRAHDWPGNLRELRSVIECAFVFAAGERIERPHVEEALCNAAVGDASEEASFERRRLATVLDGVGWDTRRAATILGIHRSSLYRRMKRLLLVGPTEVAERSAPAPIRANSHPFAGESGESALSRHTQVQPPQGVRSTEPWSGVCSGRRESDHT